MIDSNATERISKSLRRFIRHQTNRAYIDAGQTRWLMKIADEIDEKHEQAIAATLGRGECECVDGKCSECGKDMPEDPYSDYEGNFCPSCGKAVKR